MTAADAMRIAENAGIQVTLDGESLVLAAAINPPAEVIEILALNKAAIVDLLRGANGEGALEEWRELFDERAGIAEFEGGLSRKQAEVQALCHCVDEWLDRNLVRSSAGYCAFCGQSQGQLAEYIWGNSTRDPSEVWLHHECSLAWHRARRENAVEMLSLLCSYPCNVGKTLH
jgi:hypothetical protein